MGGKRRRLCGSGLCGACVSPAAGNNVREGAGDERPTRLWCGARQRGGKGCIRLDAWREGAAPVARCLWPRCPLDPNPNHANPSTTATAAAAVTHPCVLQTDAGALTQESCVQYNMLKIARTLFTWTGDPGGWVGGRAAWQVQHP